MRRTEDEDAFGGGRIDVLVGEGRAGAAVEIAGVWRDDSAGARAHVRVRGDPRFGQPIAQLVVEFVAVVRVPTARVRGATTAGRSPARHGDEFGFVVLRNIEPAVCAKGYRRRKDRFGGEGQRECNEFLSQGFVYFVFL